MESRITRTTCPVCNSKAITKMLNCKDYTVSGESFEIWQCNDCTLRFTQQVPEPAFIGKYYQSENYISHSDTEKGLVNKLYKLARNYTLEWKMKLVKQSLEKGKSEGNLLDIGTGTGAFLHKAAQSGWRVTGVEPDEGARKIALQKYQLTIQSPERLFDIQPDQYDAVTMWHVLEHVHELHEYLDSIKKVLKPTGLAFIALPNYTSKDANKYGSHWAAYDVPRHLYHFSPKSMSLLAEQHQLKLVTIKPMWLDAFYIALLSEQYQHGRGNMMAAFLAGLQSNLAAHSNKETCSSLVYVLQPVAG